MSSYHSPSSMLKLFEAIHLDDLTTDFVPDDHAVPLISRRAARPASSPAVDVADPFHLLKAPEASTTQPVRRGSRNRGPATATSSKPTGRQSRSAGRAEAYHRKRSDNIRTLHASTSMADRALKSRGYTGPLAGGSMPGDELFEVEIGDGLAVSVYDSHGYKTAHRANLCKDLAINDACVAAAQLVQALNPTFDENQERGAFKTYYFSLHRGSVKVPRMSKDVVKNPELYDRLATVLEPVRKQVEAIFKAEFPLLYERYAHAARTVVGNVAGTSAAFFPFASYCINVGGRRGVSTEEHIDVQNLGPGLCVVVPWGDFDPSIDCKLHVKELGFTFQLAPGTPIFFPSALYTHYNSKLISMGVRGSLVAWTGGSIFQYVDLGCRAVNELGREEKAEYLKGLKSRILKGFGLFPRNPAV
ncbi:hypothetical protein GGX14DRAFT_555053 [Mycena pura]|uniref:Uncharacterized protein n=1 Tax=Mycena pura TaxID=153505 RepID=A0AAD6YTZ4_9AGAR|nr:hypothetical protein GGX14DRAFT_555053 [Mycena pura]